MKTIPLTRGEVAIVDDKWHAALVGLCKWYLLKVDKQKYAVNSKHGLMHRVIMKLSAGRSPPRVDHIDGCGLNNRKRNLRCSDHRQNLLNRGTNKNSTSGFKGVWWRADTKKWAATIRVHGRTKHLGSFHDKTEAAKAYNRAAKKHFGRFAWLNKV